MERNELKNQWLDITQASEYLKLSKSSIYKRTSTNTIPYHKIGKKLLFRIDELEGYVRIFDARPNLPGIKVER